MNAFCVAGTEQSFPLIALNVVAKSCLFCVKSQGGGGWGAEAQFNWQAVHSLMHGPIIIVTAGHKHCIIYLH